MSGGTPGRVRRERSATESLLSIVLVLEAIVVFFVALTVYGLEQLPAGVALGGGAVLILVLVLDARLVRTPLGIWLGWALQLGLILLGLVNPVMWFVGAGFAALWTYCFFRGRQLDRAKAAHLAANPQAAGDPADAATPATPASRAEPADPSPPGASGTDRNSKETK